MNEFEVEREKRVQHTIQWNTLIMECAKAGANLTTDCFKAFRRNSWSGATMSTYQRVTLEAIRSMPKHQHSIEQLVYGRSHQAARAGKQLLEEAPTMWALALIPTYASASAPYALRRLMVRDYDGMYLDAALEIGGGKVCKAFGLCLIEKEPYATEVACRAAIAHVYFMQEDHVLFAAKKLLGNVEECIGVLSIGSLMHALPQFGTRLEQSLAVHLGRLSMGDLNFLKENHPKYSVAIEKAIRKKALLKVRRRNSNALSRK